MLAVDKKNVYILTNTSKFTKEFVVEELKKEGYTDKFVFDVDVTMDDKRKLVVVADEIWTWGDCKSHYAYRVAVEIGADIWTMA